MPKKKEQIPKVPLDHWEPSWSEEKRIEVCSHRFAGYRFICLGTVLPKEKKGETLFGKVLVEERKDSDIRVTVPIKFSLRSPERGVHGVFPPARYVDTVCLGKSLHDRFALSWWVGYHFMRCEGIVALPRIGSKEVMSFCHHYGKDHWHEHGEGGSIRTDYTSREQYRRGLHERGVHPGDLGRKG